MMATPEFKASVDKLNRHILSGEIGAAKQQFEECCTIAESKGRNPEEVPEINQCLAGILTLEAFHVLATGKATE